MIEIREKKGRRQLRVLWVSDTEKERRGRAKNLLQYLYFIFIYLIIYIYQERLPLRCSKNIKFLILKHINKLMLNNINKLNEMIHLS